MGRMGAVSTDFLIEESVCIKYFIRKERKLKFKRIIRMAELPTVTTSQPHLAKQDLNDLDIGKLTPLSPEVISRQATINIGTIGHVAHGKSTVVKAISGVHTVRFKNELERNITIRVGYANAKLYGIDMSTVDEELKTDNMEIKPEFYCARGSAHPDT